MDERGRPPLACHARRRVVETRVQERARGRRDQAKGLLRVAVVDQGDMVGEGGQRLMRAPERRANRRGNEISCRHGRSRRENARSRKAGSNRASHPPGIRRPPASRSRARSGRSYRSRSTRNRGGLRRAGGRARRRHHGSSGIRHRAGGWRGRSEYRCGRPRCRDRHVRERSSPAARCRPSPRSRSRTVRGRRRRGRRAQSRGVLGPIPAPRPSGWCSG